MMKFLTIAIAMAALCGGASMAQTNKMYQPQRFTDFAFEGILLDMNQQARIDSLNAATKAADPKFNVRPGECADSASTPRGEHPSYRHFGSTRHHGMRQPSVSRDYVLKVKEILTPEQYTTFLENIVLSPIMQRPVAGDVMPAAAGRSSGVRRDMGRDLKKADGRMKMDRKDRQDKTRK